MGYPEAFLLSYKIVAIGQSREGPAQLSLGSGIDYQPATATYGYL
jgi:hypothetical protein